MSRVNRQERFSLEFLFKIGVIILIILAFVILAKVINRRLRSHHTDMEDGAEEVQRGASIIYETVFVGCLWIALVISAYILDFNTGLLIWGITFGIAYASKAYISSLLSGIMILSTKEFTMGDIIELQYAKGKTCFGRIDNITLRYTVLKRLTRRRVIVPNFMMTECPIVTYTSEDLVRLETRMNLHYSEDIDHCKKIIREAIDTQDFVKEKDATLIFIETIWPEHLTMKVYFYIDPKAGRLRFKAISDVNHAIFEKFKENNIVFSYPHAQVTLDKPGIRDSQMLWAIGHSFAR